MKNEFYNYDYFIVFRVCSWATIKQQTGSDDMKYSSSLHMTWQIRANNTSDKKQKQNKQITPTTTATPPTASLA